MKAAATLDSFHLNGELARIQRDLSDMALHDGNPFEDTSAVPTMMPGWELVLGQHRCWITISPTIIRNVPIANGSEQMTLVRSYNLR